MLKPISCRGLIFGEACLLEEYYFLFGISALLRPATILEIGTSTGLGTMALWLGAHSANNRHSHITTIDINAATTPIVKKNWATAGVKMSVQLLVGDSHVIVPKLKKAKRTFGLCFVDGSHKYEDARQDWEDTQGMTPMWLFHDSTQMPGVRQLISEIKETDDYSVFEFGAYPFGTQWFAPAKAYGPKKSIPGITLVAEKDPKFQIAPEEQAWIDVAKASQ